MFCKKGVLKNFARLTGKHPCQNLFCRPCNFIKKETLAQVFSREFYKIFKNTSGRLFLSENSLHFPYFTEKIHRSSTEELLWKMSQKSQDKIYGGVLVSVHNGFFPLQDIDKIVVLLSGVCFCFKYHALKLCTLKEKMFPISLQFQDCVSTRKPWRLFFNKKTLNNNKICIQRIVYLFLEMVFKFCNTVESFLLLR